MNTYDYDGNLDSFMKELLEGPSSSVLLEVSNALQSDLMDQDVPAIHPHNGQQNWEPVPYQNGSPYQNWHHDTYNGSLMQYNPQLYHESIPTNGGGMEDIANFSIGQSNNVMTLPSYQAVNGTVHLCNSDKKNRKRKRTIFNIEQMIALEQEYNKSRYIERNRRLQLAKEIQLSERTIKVWFQNQRMKHKKEITEHERNMPIRPDLIQHMPQNDMAQPFCFIENSRHRTFQQLPEY